MNTQQVVHHITMADKATAGTAATAAFVAIFNVLPTAFGVIAGSLSIILTLLLIRKARVALAREKITKEKAQIELEHARKRRKGDN